MLPRKASRYATKGSRRHTGILFVMNMLNTLELLRGSTGAAFVYRCDDHRVLDANQALYSQWGYSPAGFLGTNEGLYRLWINPVDWGQHESRLSEFGTCVGLHSRLHHADGRLIEARITSLILQFPIGPLVLTYLLPDSVPSVGPVFSEDERDFYSLLNMAGLEESTTLLQTESSLY